MRTGPRRCGTMRALGLAAVLAMAAAANRPAAAAETVVVEDFAPNPGRLRMLERVPDGLRPGAPLVVALHGCTQDARGFDDESGWAAVADRYGFALLLPEQRAANNSSLCFTFWDELAGERRAAEIASIASMVNSMAERHRVDRGRVFVAGLSAGGAMTATLLATRPDLFRAGAVVAGVPFGCSSTEGRPFLALNRQWFVQGPYGEAGWAAYSCGISRLPGVKVTPLPREAGEWAALVRAAASPGTATWPKISLWQGGGDGTVHPSNLRELLEQWTEVHGVDRRPDAEEEGRGWRRLAYADRRGDVLVETFELEGLGHAVPVDPDGRELGCGRAGAGEHFADVDLCAALRIARFWGIAGERR